ncbi:MAG: three-Cys-motif partner protein TcmP [Candidatus Thermoplasmatota archaeon]|jgi:three-Cys-motif partner protein
MTPPKYGFPAYVPYPKSAGTKIPRETVLDYLKLLDYLGRLIEKAAGKSTQDLADEEYRPHDVTYLKLLLLWSYTLRFFQFGKRATRWYYIDLLSASGLSYTKSFPDDPVPGSCFMVPLADQRFYDPDKPLANGFAKVFCLDQDNAALARIAERRTALEKAYGLQFPEYSYHGDDANTSIAKVLEEIEAEAAKPIPKGALGPLTLVFVDNLGLNIHMRTIREIQQRIRADLVVHLPTHAIWRCIEAYRKAGNEYQALNDFFGCDEWKNVTDASQIPTLYHKLVQEATGHVFQDFTPVPIHGEKSRFHLCIYVRHTQGTDGKDGWLAIIRKLAEECGTITYETIHSVRAVSSGKQKTLF